MEFSNLVKIAGDEPVFETSLLLAGEVNPTIGRRHLTLQLQHHDRASMLAGKLHAVLQRSYLKGRDLYDLLWYLSDPNWPAPNLTLLNNALLRTHWTGKPLTKNNWRAAVRQQLKTVDWQSVVNDMRPIFGTKRRPESFDA